MHIFPWLCVCEWQPYPPTPRVARCESLHHATVAAGWSKAASTQIASHSPSGSHRPLYEAHHSALLPAVCCNSVASKRSRSPYLIPLVLLCDAQDRLYCISVCSSQRSVEPFLLYRCLPNQTLYLGKSNTFIYLCVMEMDPARALWYHRHWEFSYGDQSNIQLKSKQMLSRIISL